jgi:hypothetical protein
VLGYSVAVPSNSNQVLSVRRKNKKKLDAAA